MIPRKIVYEKILEYQSVFPICAVIGPRQSGKTTLALEYASQYPDFIHFDLEDPQDFERFQYPQQALKAVDQLIIIDEIQRMPALFPYLRVCVDRHPSMKLLILGSSSPDLLRQSSESLAGRVGYIELTPFSSMEVDDLEKLWKRGGYPKAYLALSERVADLWLKEYIKNFLERDLAIMQFGIDAYQMRKLWMMAAHYHANMINFSELGRSLNLSDITIKKYLIILESTFMVRLLRPWHENLGKRQVKNPKLYIRDSGILHTLLGMNINRLDAHPKVGASWEGFALEEIIRLHQTDPQDCYFWRTQDGAELDLLLVQGDKRLGFEFKFGCTIKPTRSMKIALDDLKLDKLTVVTFDQDQPFWLDPKIEVLSLNKYVERARKNL